MEVVRCEKVIPLHKKRVKKIQITNAHNILYIGIYIIKKGHRVLIIY